MWSVIERASLPSSQQLAVVGKTLIRQSQREREWQLATHVVVCLSMVGLLAVSNAVAQPLYKCIDAKGKVSYQQRKCDGSGTELEATPANQQYREPATITESVKVPASKAIEPDKAKAVPKEATNLTAALPPMALEAAKGRLDGWPKSGDGLVEGMSPIAVIRAWGRPHEVKDYGGGAVFFHYCDLRVALIWNGQLASWSAMFPDSKRGAFLYQYGEPWIRAPQKWGVERDRKSYMVSAEDRGDVQEWTKTKWIVTDVKGNIVSWCDAADYRGRTIPPTHKTLWEQ